MAGYITIFKSGTRSGTDTSTTVYNSGVLGAAHITVNVTAGSNLSVGVRGLDRVSNQDYEIITSVLPNGVTVIKVGPDYTAAANVAKDYLPSAWFVEATTSGSTTYSIGASII